MKIYKVKKKKQEDLKNLMIQLLDIQLFMLRTRGLTDNESFEIEIAKFLRDYVSVNIVKGEYCDTDKEKIHPYIVWKYPEVFQIFQKEYIEFAQQYEKDKNRRVKEQLRRLESQHKNILEMYSLWRIAAQKANLSKLYTDCSFIEARKKFSEYCRLSEPISYEVMLYCEQKYEGSESGSLHS